MADHMEGWLIDIGDEILRKKVSVGVKGLEPVEAAVYALWVVDYSVRNSGTLIPMTELYPVALQQLGKFATLNDLPALRLLALGALDDELFCNKYYQWFEAASRELKRMYVR